MDEIVRAIDPISGVGIVDGTGRGGAVPMDRVRGPKSGRDGWGVRSFTSYVHQTTCLQSIRISWFVTTETRLSDFLGLSFVDSGCFRAVPDEPLSPRSPR